MPSLQLVNANGVLWVRHESLPAFVLKL